MWQIGHVPGTAERTSGCIEHQYFSSLVGLWAGGLTRVGLWAGILARVGLRAKLLTVVGLSRRLTIVGPSHAKPDERSRSPSPTREGPLALCPTIGRSIFICRPS